MYTQSTRSTVLLEAFSHNEYHKMPQKCPYILCVCVCVCVCVVHVISKGERDRSATVVQRGRLVHVYIHHSFGLRT